MKHTIHLEQKHIQVGEPQSCRFCPIALAIIQATGFEYIRIIPHSVRAYDSPDVQKAKLLWFASLPSEATTFIYEFDSYVHNLKPFSFEIDTTENVEPSF